MATFRHSDPGDHDIRSRDDYNQSGYDTTKRASARQPPYLRNAIPGGQHQSADRGSIPVARRAKYFPIPNTGAAARIPERVRQYSSDSIGWQANPRVDLANQRKAAAFSG